MKFFKRKAAYTVFGHKRNDYILEELKIEAVDEKLRRQKSNSLKHVTGMNKEMPKIMLNYRPNGRRRLVRPPKGPLEEAGTGLSRSNS